MSLQFIKKTSFSEICFNTFAPVIFSYNFSYSLDTSGYCYHNYFVNFRYNNSVLVSLANFLKVIQHSEEWSSFSSVTFSCSLCSCPNSGCGRGRRRAVLLLVLGCHVFPISAPLDPAFLSRLWQESNSLSSRSFSTIQLFSWARALNFSCRKSLVLSCNKFWVRWSLKKSKITQKKNQLKAKHKVHKSFLF